MAGNQNSGGSGGMYTPAGNPASAPAQPSLNPTPPMNTSPVPSAATAPAAQPSGSSPPMAAPQAQPDTDAFQRPSPMGGGFQDRIKPSWQGYGGQGWSPWQGQQGWNPWQGFGGGQGGWNPFQSFGQNGFDMEAIQRMMAGFGQQARRPFDDGRRDSIDAPGATPPVASPVAAPVAPAPSAPQGGLGSLVNPNRDYYMGITR